MSKTATWAQHKERGSLFWLRIMCALSLRLGRTLTRPILYGIALYFLLAARTARAASRDYLSHILGRPARWREMYAHILTFASTIHDRVFFLNERLDAFDIQLHGAETLYEMHRRRGGLFLFGGHIGSFEALRACARLHPPPAPPVYLAMYEENARRINGVLSAINPRNTPKIIPLGKLDSMLQARQCLEDGAVIGILADRSLAEDNCVPVSFLGRTAYLPTGPFRMAAILKRPIICMAGLHRGGKRYDVHFTLITDFSDVQAPQREAAIAAAMENYVRTLESYCRMAPLNWFNFYDFWKQSSSGRA